MLWWEIPYADQNNHVSNLMAWRIFDNGIVVVNDTGMNQTVTVDPQARGQNAFTIPMNIMSDIPPDVTGLYDVFAGQPVIPVNGVYTLQVPASHYAATNRWEASGRLFAFIRTGASSPRVAVLSSQNASLSGQPVTLRSTVASTATVTPTGTVTFMDGTTSLGAKTLADGAAALSTSGLAVGSHSITAAYSGDSNFPPVTSTGITQVVLSWTPTSAVPAPDGTTHLLWTDGTSASGYADLRILAANGSIRSDVTLGPRPGWTALALSVAPDNSNHILWLCTDGTVS